MLAQVVAAATLLAGPGVAAYEAIGAYMPVNGVLEHSQMSLDVAAFRAALSNEVPHYAGAKAVYELSGGNSCRSPTDGRALGGFNKKNMSGEAFYEAFMAAGFAPDFWDSWMRSALDGTGDFAGAPHAKRVASLKAGAMGLVTLYVTHVMEIGISKGAVPETRADNASAFFWDMGWAFYHGASPDGADAPWGLARECDTDFPGGLQVSLAIAPHFNKGLAALRSRTYNAGLALVARETIYRMWAVTYLRSVLKALREAEGSQDAAAHARAHASFRAIDGWVHARNAAAADAVREKLAITQVSVPPGTFCAVKRTLESAYPAMGLNCSVVGALPDEANTPCAGCADSPAWFPAGQPAVAPVAATVTDVTCKKGPSPEARLRR